MQISFKQEMDRISKDLTSAQKILLEQGAVSAINRTTDKVRVEASSIIRNEEGLNLKKAYVDSKLKPTKASKGNLRAVINTKSAKATNLIEYVGGNFSRFRARTKKGAFTAAAKRGVRARPYEKSQTYKGAFIGSGKDSGKQLVLKRTSSNRNSRLEPVYGPSLRRTFIRTKTQDRLRLKAQTEFPKELDGVIKFRLSRFVK